jgi:hypothetical protein
MKKIVRLLILLVACILACNGCPANGNKSINEIRKGRPWIPATTRLVQNGGTMVLLDFTAYEFENDPAVLGSWQSIDFVNEKSVFMPGVRSWTDDLFLKSLTFLPNGVIEGNPRLKWTKGHVLDAGDMNTDSSYEIIESSGKIYMFFQWKSGDYILRYDKPSYYVLVKGEASPSGQNEAAASPAQADETQYGDLLSAKGKLEIVRHPSPADFTRYAGRGKLTSMPSYDQSSTKGWQVDVRSCDLSGLDLSKRLVDLQHADFDSLTKWPAKLAKSFDPARIMERGKNPGLGLRSLHAKGITGKGIGLAIIDQALLVDHGEYKDRLKLYEEIHWPKDPEAQMHAPAVASIAVGKNVGVAPEADLYFIANWMGISTAGGGFQYELSSLARSIDRIVEVNAELRRENRIRVISISLGINPGMKSYELVRDSIANAAKNGIYVVYVGSDPFLGMGRDPVKNPDDFASYGPGDFWRRQASAGSGMIMIPMDSRCTAGPTGEEDYAFYRQGGMSWTVPYVAGLYALASQVRPDITPQAFWSAASKTAEERKFGKIINPAKLLNELGE